MVRLIALYLGLSLSKLLCVLQTHSALIMFTPGVFLTDTGSLAVAFHMAELKYTLTLTLNLQELFGCAHLKLSTQSNQANKQANTHTCAQCSHTSVGLTQACPN